MNRASEIIYPMIENITDTNASIVTAKSIEERIDLIFEEIEDGKADPKIRLLVANIIRDIPERDYLGELNAIFDWVKQNVRYTHDPYNLELFNRPKRVIEYGIADCDDLTILLGSMVQTIGYPIKLRVIGVNSDEPEHIYLMAGIPPIENSEPSDWIAMDASVDEPMGWQIDRDKVRYVEDFELED